LAAEREAKIAHYRQVMRSWADGWPKSPTSADIAGWANKRIEEGL
jgi:hypothetical protein